MSKIVILGAGIAGHVAATHLRRKLSKEHEVVVVSPNGNYQWIPSNIWVGVGRMKSEDILFPLTPLYKKKGIDFKRAKVTTFHPEGDTETLKPYVNIQYVLKENQGTNGKSNLRLFN
ncbi:FAD-dependent oxidoreductase [Zobellia nedashkovskayae]